MHGLEIFQLDDCEELRVLGEGGQAIVKQMRHPRLGTFACKIWNAAGAGRADREVTFQLQLRHPNIIRFFAFCPPSAPGQPSAVAMGYMRRESIDRCVGHLNLAEKCAAIASIISELTFIHENGFVHADVKPSNVIVGTPVSCSYRRF
jgi:serine/threonine protein kinase